MRTTAATPYDPPIRFAREYSDGGLTWNLSRDEVNTTVEKVWETPQAIKSFLTRLTVCVPSDLSPRAVYRTIVFSPLIQENVET
jgi:hypothetical protein